MATLIAAVLLIVLSTSNVYSGSASARVRVSVRVLPYINYNVMRSVSALNITNEDLARGYKEIDEGALMSVKTNDPRGFMIALCGQPTENIDSITVRVGHDVIDLPSYGCTELYSPGSENDQVKKIAYKIYLPDTAREGLYPLPITVSALPL
ncbi:MAG: hypothetical protein ISR96_09435 [Nitrospira sp.]|nr:hypothetical protein [Nitrospira sp.]